MSKKVKHFFHKFHALSPIPPLQSTFVVTDASKEGTLFYLHACDHVILKMFGHQNNECKGRSLPLLPILPGKDKYVLKIMSLALRLPDRGQTFHRLQGARTCKLPTGR